MNNPDRFKMNSDQKTARLFLLGGGSLASLAIASPVRAQSATIDTASVSTQLTATQTALVGVGGTLLAMAMGIVLFIIGKKIIKRVTSG
jgi:hypothetical protein